MIPSENDDEEQDQDSLGTDTGRKKTPRYKFSQKETIAWWLFLQLLFLVGWGVGFVIWGVGFIVGRGILLFFFAWLMYGPLAYLGFDILNGYYEAGAKREERKLVSLECTHCGAFYAYPESSIDSADNSVECQNCARRFQFDTRKGIQNY